MGAKQSDYRKGRVRKDSATFHRKAKHRKVRDREIDARLDRKRTSTNLDRWL